MYTYKNVTDKKILIWDADLKPISPNQIFISYSRLNIHGILEITQKNIEDELLKLEEIPNKKKKS